MFEPITLTVTELAARWNCTTRQVFEQARHLRLVLYFPFDGFAYDVLEERRRTYEEWKEKEEVTILKRRMDVSQERLRRHAAMEVSEWEDGLSDEDVKSIQSELAKHSVRLDVLQVLAAARHTERERSRYLGDLIASPDTVAACERDGFARFPEVAYHPASNFTLTRAGDGEYGVLDGRMLRLGERRDSRDRLGADDLRVLAADIKAIEPTRAPTVEQAKQTTSPPAPAIELRDAGRRLGAPNPSMQNDVVPWTLRDPERYQGYGKPLYDALRSAHDEGRDLPRARDILDIWNKKQPPEIIEVLSDSVKYYDSNNNSKTATVRAVQKSIGRLARLAADSPS